MAHRPDVFDKEEFQASLRRQGCTESFVSPVTSDFRLFVPLLIREIGETKFFEIVDRCRDELGLGEQQAAWHVAVRYIVGWAEEEVNDYKARR